MKDYSLDLRYRIVQAVADGQPKTAVAQRFAVSLSTVQRYVRQQSRTGTLTPRPRPGRPRRIPVGQESALAAHVAAHTAATLAERCQQWAAQSGVLVSQATMSRALTRAGLSRKNASCANDAPSRMKMIAAMLAPRRGCEAVRFRCREPEKKWSLDALGQRPGLCREHAEKS